MQPFSANPGSLKGVVTLVDDEGVSWVLHRKRLELRAVRGLMKNPAVVLVWGDVGGLRPRMVREGRAELWGLVACAYGGPGGTADGRYVAHEFRAGPERRLLYVEDHC